MKENLIQINVGIMINVDAGVKNISEEDNIWNSASCSCKNGQLFSKYYV